MNINCDWLQISARGIFAAKNENNFREENFQTRHFKKVRVLIHNGIEVGTLASEPHSRIIKDDLHIFKLKNEFCYTENPFQLTGKIIEEVGLKIHGITRIDLATDFNYFHNQLCPAKFIQRFMSNTYLKSTRSKYKLQGTQLNEHIFEYLRFGANSSPISVYLYNKSKEMEEVKFKPYIKKLWIDQGLNSELPVWRLETSLKASQIFELDKNSGEIIRANFNNFLEIDFLVKIFLAAINTIFKFKINDGQENKSRMKDLKLFEEINLNKRLILIPDKYDHTKSDKQFLTKLENLNNELSSRNDFIAEMCTIVKNDFIDTRSLYKYYDNLLNKRSKPKSA